jgi:hypothetical protein
LKLASGALYPPIDKWDSDSNNSEYPLAYVEISGCFEDDPGILDFIRRDYP